MTKPAAKKGDRIEATDIHFVILPGASNPIPKSFNFSEEIEGGLSRDVRIADRPAATLGSTAMNKPSHKAEGSFVNPPTNRATIIEGSPSVRVNDRRAARSGDHALTCNDPADRPVGVVKAQGTVRIGD
jgi:uncharacterized Zn-binding protein involved in type VI secretion